MTDNLLCRSCQYFYPVKNAEVALGPDWKGLCNHKDLEEANLVGTVHHCRAYLRIVYPTRLDRVVNSEE